MEEDIEDLVQHLQEHHRAVESYILVREVRLWSATTTGQHYEYGIKVYRAPKGRDLYTFETSHHVHTPIQMGPYVTSVNDADSQRHAIDLAINTINPWIDNAIQQGHPFSETWLVRNDRY